MIAHAKADFPLECCGILAGKDDNISHIYKMKNNDRSRTSYLMDPKEQISVFKEMRSLDIEMKAIYHSHPNHPAYPSMTDVELAYYPEAVYIIISINNNRDTKVLGFRIIHEEITEEELSFLPYYG
jgi:proteasome lid subunit RPN8/RPN11